MSSEGQCTAFYQSHSTILHNYNIYRCSWVCLFTSNDGDEQWREHRINKMQFNTDKAKTVFISQYRARLQERIYHRASWHSHDGSSSLYSSWTDSRVPVSKKRKKISSLIHLNINTLVASFDRYAELKHRLCGWKWAVLGFIHMWSESSLYLNFSLRLICIPQQPSYNRKDKICKFKNVECLTMANWRLRLIQQYPLFL